jgi:pimeloyl-ACP methyl ester carboxylesterase
MNVTSQAWYRERQAMVRIISLLLLYGASAAVVAQPAPPGRLVDLGGHKLHMYCTGRGVPTVVVENGLGDFSFDWTLVQSRVSAFTRICTYDRGGYAWSDPGPKPRTFAQLNLELHDGLTNIGEHGPFVLVGHSFGGPVTRNFASQYPSWVAGMLLLDAAHEGLHVGIGGGKTIRLGDGAKGAVIPTPREQMIPSDKSTLRAEDLPQELRTLDSIFKVLPLHEQNMQLWAQQLPGVYDAENSETQWSDEYFAKWLATPQTRALGNIPLIVMSRADGGYKEGESNVPSEELEKERKEGQGKLLLLSSKSRQIIIHSGHNMNLEAPEEVSKAIHELVGTVRDAGERY